MRIRIRSIVSVPALVIGLVASFPTGAFAQSADARPIRRSPSAADLATSPAPGAGPAALARGEALPAMFSRQPAASPADFGQPFGPVAQPSPFGGQQRLEQRRSPGGSGGGGGGSRGGAVIRSGGGGGPQGGGPPQGGARVAVPRSSAGYPGRPGGGYYHGGHSNHVVVAPYPYYAYPYYYPYAYSSFYGGFYDSYWYGGVGFGATWGPGWGPGWGGAYYGGYPAYAYGRGFDFGRLRLQVGQRDAEVFIDGSYAGKVDDFDGRFQGLQLETGAYKVEIRKPGWETLAFDVRVTPDRTTTYKAEMIPQKP